MRVRVCVCVKVAVSVSYIGRHMSIRARLSNGHAVQQIELIKIVDSLTLSPQTYR